MGLELQVFEEFWPITPVRTHAIAIKGLSSKNEEEEDDCQTPTSPSRTLSTPFECPPAPKKPRRVAVPPPRNVVVRPQQPSQQFFQVPHDLSSVFFPPASSNNIKATS